MQLQTSCTCSCFRFPFLRSSSRVYSTRGVPAKNPAPSLLPLTECEEYETKHAFSHYSNWLLPGQLMVGRYPYIEPGLTRRCDTHEKGMNQLEEIMRTEIQTFLCLQDEIPPQKELPETGSLGFFPYHGWCEELKKSVEFLHFPIVDLSVPDADRLDAFLAGLQRRVMEGEGMYIHCWGGRGRAGLVGCCLLAKTFQIPAEEALERVGRAYSTRNDPKYRSPETEEQVQFVKNYVDTYC